MSNAQRHTPTGGTVAASADLQGGSGADSGESIYPYKDAIFTKRNLYTDFLPDKYEI